MFSSNKSGWYLPFSILTLTFLLYIALGLWFTEWISSGRYIRSPNALERYLSPETIDALYEDKRLQDAFLKLSVVVAEASSQYGETHDSERWKNFGSDLLEEVARLKSEKTLRRKRGLLEDFGNLITGGGSNGATNGGGPGNITAGLGNLFSQGLAGIGNSLTEGLATPALFLGIGLGMGVENGLNLTTPEESKIGAVKIAQSMGQESTGINMVAQNLGTGLSGQLSSAFAPTNNSDSSGNGLLGGLGSLPIGLAAFSLAQGIGQGTSRGLKLTQTTMNPVNSSDIMAIAQNFGMGVSEPIASNIDIQSLMSRSGAGLSSLPIGLMAFSLAQGIGQGTSSGLKLTQEKFEPVNNSDVTTIAQNLGLGISTPIASSIDVQSLLSQAGSGGGISLNQLPQIAASAGVGLGEGASRGLGFAKPGPAGSLSRKRQAPQDPNSLDIPGAVGNFTLGLSESFLKSADLNKALSSSGLASGGGGIGGFNFSDISFVSLASGAGKGIGEGIAIGLDSNAPRNLSTKSFVVNDSGIDPDQEQIAEQFTKGLLASFLQNGGVKSVGNAVTSNAGGLTSSIDLPKTAEGVGRGLVEGSIHALSQAGGFQKVIAGDFPKELAFTLPPLPVSTFNDSLNGSAVAFTRGLAGEGVLLVSQLVKTTKDKSTLLRRDSTQSIEHGGLLVSRQAAGNQTALIPSPAIDSKTLEGFAQTGIDTLTCGGVGGLAAVGLGLFSNPAVKNSITSNTGNSTPLDPSTLAALPKDPIKIKSGDTTFIINITNPTAITINEMPVVPFAVVTAFHITLTTIAFIYALPIYVALGAIQRISVMLGHPFNETRVKWWRNLLLLGIFTPTAFVGIIMGIVGMGKARHFATPHGVFGLLTLLILIPTITASFIRLRTQAPPPPPSAFVGIKQLPALLKAPNKIHIISAMLVQLSLALSMMAWVQGFSILRTVSLCVVDALLIGPIVVPLVSVLTFVPFASAIMVILRQYFETQIAKLGNSTTITYNEKSAAYDTHPSVRSPSPSSLTDDFRSRPQTKDLTGRPDSQISWPVRVRKWGEEDSIVPASKGSANSSRRSSGIAPKTEGPDANEIGQTRDFSAMRNGAESGVFGLGEFNPNYIRDERDELDELRDRLNRV
ncbi:hypothetical protein DM02DRAFT_670923 [Periconia macrospinosa]|uniref:Cytochrome b561 domain-containing protein n=1 Tax=Periconia macrospinosa TaxID=97972 RepID=A0A2V1DU84_9PLEO|nr:hypothetical protein DM02DRAFT_670923 [Periconia macrospinosa]